MSKELERMKLQALRAKAMALKSSGQAGPGLAETVAGRTARMGAQGLASIVDVAGNPIKQVISLATGEPVAPSYREQVSGLLDQAGVVGYDNSAVGRITGAIGEGMVGAGGTAKLADVAGRAATGIGQTVASAMAAEPGRQVAAGAGAALGSQGAAEAGMGAAGQLLFGLAGGAAGYAASGGRQPRPAQVSVEGLRDAKNKAYRAVDDAGEIFTPQDTAALLARTKQYLADENYLPEVDTQTAAVLNRIEGAGQNVLSLGKLDKLRQDVWARYSRSKEQVLLSVIEAIDETIASRADSNSLMASARAAHAKYKKAELLDQAFKVDELQTSSTGSGGNILNKMRQSVASILADPKKAKWFSQPEKDAMKAFITGTPSQNMMRLIGKLAPTGNGLMTAINLMAVATNPAAIVASGVASAAKVLSDRSTMNQGTDLVNIVGGAARPAPTTNALGGYAATLPGQLPALNRR